MASSTVQPAPPQPSRSAHAHTEPKVKALTRFGAQRCRCLVYSPRLLIRCSGGVTKDHARWTVDGFNTARATVQTCTEVGGSGNIRRTNRDRLHCHHLYHVQRDKNLYCVSSYPLARAIRPDDFTLVSGPCIRRAAPCCLACRSSADCNRSSPRRGILCTLDRRELPIWSERSALLSDWGYRNIIFSYLVQSLSCPCPSLHRPNARNTMSLPNTSCVPCCCNHHLT